MFARVITLHVPEAKSEVIALATGDWLAALVKHPV